MGATTVGDRELRIDLCMIFNINFCQLLWVGRCHLTLVEEYFSELNLIALAVAHLESEF